MGTKYCDERVCMFVCLSVCMFVCLSICLSARISQTPHDQTLRNFLYTSTVTVAWSSSDKHCDMLCTSGFVDDIMFAHSRPSKGGASRAYIQSDSPGGCTGAKSDVYDCIVNYYNFIIVVSIVIINDFILDFSFHSYCRPICRCNVRFHWYLWALLSCYHVFVSIVITVCMFSE